MQKWQKIILGAGCCLFLIYGFWPWYTNQQKVHREFLEKERTQCPDGDHYTILAQEKQDGSINTLKMCEDGTTRFLRNIPRGEVDEATREYEQKPSKKKAPFKKKKTTPPHPQPDKKSNKREDMGRLLPDKATRLSRKGSAQQQEIVNLLLKKSGYRVDLVLTFDRESRLDPCAVGQNTDGTTDHGICQLNSRWHSEFVASHISANNCSKTIIEQVAYCVGVWQDAEKKGRVANTFHAYKKRFEREIVANYQF